MVLLLNWNSDVQIAEHYLLFCFFWKNGQSSFRSFTVLVDVQGARTLHSIWSSIGGFSAWNHCFVFHNVMRTKSRFAFLFTFSARECQLHLHHKRIALAFLPFPPQPLGCWPQSKSSLGHRWANRIGADFGSFTSLSHWCDPLPLEVSLSPRTDVTPLDCYPHRCVTPPHPNNTTANDWPFCNIWFGLLHHGWVWWGLSVECSSLGTISPTTSFSDQQFDAELLCLIFHCPSGIVHRLAQMVQCVCFAWNPLPKLFQIPFLK